MIRGRIYLGRILAISDIHGQADTLKKLLKLAHYNAQQDQLYLLGDYISKGPQSAKTVKLVQSLVKQGAKAIRGNHEEKEIKQQQYGGATFFKTLPYYIQTPHYVFVHAGIRPGISIDQQNHQDLTTIREPFLCNANTLSQTIVFGHTPTDRLGAHTGCLWIQHNKIGIDTGAGKDAFLSLVDLTNRLQYRIKIKQQSFSVITW